MHKKNLLKSNFLLTNFIVMIFPVLVLSIISGTLYTNLVTKIVIDKATNDLKRIAYNFDMMLEQFKNISIQVGNEKGLATQSLNNNSIAYREVYRVLGSYTRLNRFASEIFFYNKYGNHLYTADFVYNLKIYYEQINHFDNPDYKEFVGILNNIGSPTWITLKSSVNAKSPSGALTILAIPVYGYCKGDSLMLYVFQHDALSSYIGDDGSDKVFITIFSNSSETIFTSKKSSIIDTGILKDTYSRLKPDTFQKVLIKDKQYYLAYTPSVLYDISYIQSIPVEIMLKEIRTIQAAFIAGLFAVLIFGSFIAVVFSRNNYKPIKQLVNKVKAFSHSQNPNENELEFTCSAMNNLYESFNEGNRERTLTGILYGRYSSLAQLESDCKKSNILFTAPYYCAILLNITETADTLKDFDFINILLSELQKLYTHVYPYEYINKNNYVFIINDTKQDDQSNTNKLMKIQQFYFENYSVRIIIGVGNRYKSVRDIYTSFKEAKIALNCAISNKNDALILYSSISFSSITSYSYPKGELDLLYTSISTCDIYRFKAVSQSLLLHLKMESFNYFQTICLCYEMINISLMALQEVGLETDNLKNEYVEEFIKLDTCNAETVSEIIKDYFAEILKCLVEYTGSLTKPSAIDSVTDYLKQNFTDPNMSVKVVAHHFNVSISNLSHQFKNKTGKNISFYIDELRLEMVKHLLSSTSLTLENIAMNTGYLQSSNLIRKFKQFFNQTPTEYRRNM